MQEESPGGETLEVAKPEVQETHEIKNLEALRTIADPLRLRVFEQLVSEPQTVKAVATKLGYAPGRLYYHFNLLVEHGLIEVWDRRMVGNLVETAYRAVARELRVHHDLLSFRVTSGKENLTSLAISTLDATRDDLVSSLDARSAALAAGADECPRAILVTRRALCISESRAKEFIDRLKALYADFDRAALDCDGARSEEEGTERAHAYALAVAFYPRFGYDEVSDAEA